MHDRINTMNEASSNGENGANLLHDHVFQFDFLNDSFDKLPNGLKKIIDDPASRGRLLIYINPPYVEASNARTITGTGNNRKGLSYTGVKEKYKKELGRAANEIFAQFFVRIVREIRGVNLAVFSKLKILQGPNFKDFRSLFPAQLSRLFVVPADTFDNVHGQFPIGFQIWHTGNPEEFNEIYADVYDSKSELLGKKLVTAYKDCRYIIEWLRLYYDKQNEHLAYIRFLGTDFQNNNGVFITLTPSDNDIKQVKGTWITRTNVNQMFVYFAVRLCIEQTWLNDRDQFLFPISEWKEDPEFQSNCLVFTLFHGQNRVSCQYGINHFIPFTELEVNARDNFSSHFMSDYILGRLSEDSIKPQIQDLFMAAEPLVSSDINPLVFSLEAQDVMDAGRELWRYYHQQENSNPDASFYDIRLHFQGTKVSKLGKVQMNSESPDAKYTALLSDLRKKQKVLASKIEAKVYEYGFLKK